MLTKLFFDVGGKEIVLTDSQGFELFQDLLPLYENREDEPVETVRANSAEPYAVPAVPGPRLTDKSDGVITSSTMGAKPDIDVDSFDPQHG